MHLEGPQMYQMNRQINSFQNIWGMLLEKYYRLARKIDSLQKNTSNGYFGGHDSGLPDFGRPWTPNGWHQVNCWGGPENFVI